ncbi:putative lipoic acid-binding regulatory protein [Rhodanobacter sp. TND4EL1]
MQPIDFTKAKQEGKGFEFPGEFEITAVGNSSANLPSHVPQLLERAGLHVLHESVRHRHSGAGNYVSVTVSFRCESREQYEAAHHALRSDPDIRYTH